MSLSPKSSHLPSARRKFSRKRTSAREWQLTQPRNSPTCTDVSKLAWLGALSLHWCPTNLAVNSVQLLISRLTGQVPYHYFTRSVSALIRPLDPLQKP